MEDSPDALSREVQIIKRAIENKPMILVMGVTGSGKSSFINSIPRKGSKDARVGHTLGSCTVACESFIAQIGNTEVILTDTPGFDDDTEGITDADILNEIARVLTAQYKTGAKLKGIIYLQRVMDVRLGGSGKRALKLFQAICGDAALSNVVLTTTRWDKVNLEEGIRKEAELRDNIWTQLLERGARMQKYRGTKESAVGIVSELLSKTNIVLDLQKQLVDEGKILGETRAGSLVSEDLQPKMMETREEILRLQRSLHEAKINEARRIRREEELRRENQRLAQGRAAEGKLREDIRAEVEQELKGKGRRRGSGRGGHGETVARIAISSVSAAVGIVSMLFGLDPSLADTLLGWFGVS